MKKLLTFALISLSIFLIFCSSACESVTVTPETTSTYTESTVIELTPDLMYEDGKFFKNNKKVFSYKDISSDIVKEDFKVLGCSTTNENTNYITCKYLNNIWLLIEANGSFSIEHLADNAVKEADGKFLKYWNYDSIQYYRSLFYRTTDKKLIQINLFDGYLETKVLSEKNPILICNSYGLHWINESKNEINLENRIFPDTFVSNEGTLEEYIKPSLQ